MFIIYTHTISEKYQFILGSATLLSCNGTEHTLKSQYWAVLLKAYKNTDIGNYILDWLYSEISIL